MKTYKYNILKSMRVSLLILLVSLSSCNEDEFLKEVPLDFFAPENSYITAADFDAAVLNMHVEFRKKFYESSNKEDLSNLAWGLTDLSYPHQSYGGAYQISALLLPTSSKTVYNSAWVPLYKIIYNANAIIGRAENPDVTLTEDEKFKFQAEAKFFRAYAYKILANLYGGVPVTLEETMAPKRNYTRETRDSVYNLCISDLEFAVQKLPAINEVTDASRLSNLAASHLLAELYNTVGRYSEAIDAATFVIDNPNMSLMKERFGNKIEKPMDLGFNDDPEFDGKDVYWDLFFKGNQNRSAGNREAIWLIPFEYLVPGGGQGGPGVRCNMPRLWQLKVKNNDGTWEKIIPHPNENYGGRGGGFNRPSPYFEKEVWEKSGDGDIRNAPHNIIRDWIVKNPKSDQDGKWIIKDNLTYPTSTYNDTMRDFYPVIAKATTFGGFPDEVKIDDQTVPGSIDHTNTSKRNWKAHYAMRLAETYLLRAEAHLGNGNKQLAATDINEIRSRANATPVTEGEVDIDYILDERMRELHYETFYLCTTNRLGKTVERLKKNFPLLGNQLEDYHNLWPIPFDDIEKNIEAELTQNPGY
ncbi:MAG: RagB/SusD family nutrient uptake outer membrane protein [Carboxylicivirga sp.]|jgi:hypothetical protein|nr:RagB/SusD family nutrient uptake outer membrane protein [Carboxylicivirga sp.]